MKKHFNKTIETRVIEFEVHLKFLSDAIENFNKDPMYYKQIAGELRILVADNKEKNRLMVSIMDEFKYFIELKPDYNVLKVWTLLSKKRERYDVTDPIEFRQYIKESYACRLNFHDYTIVEFIRDIAQQEGSSHESKTLDENLKSAHNILLGNIPSHIRQLYSIANQILLVGKYFIKFLIKDKGFSPRYKWD